jgi:hypothetical protein
VLTIERNLIQSCDPVHEGRQKVARIAARRVGTRRNREQGLPEMTDTAFSALVRAWATTVIATSLFLAALALASAWDSSIYLQGLREALKRAV